MAKKKYSLGPWRAEGGMVVDSRDNIVAIRYSWTHLVKDTSIERGGHITPVEADANNRLLAAAPDLLRACHVALDALGCDRVRQERLDAQKIIHAAIQKAQGE